MDEPELEVPHLREMLDEHERHGAPREHEQGEVLEALTDDLKQMMREADLVQMALSGRLITCGYALTGIGLSRSAHKYNQCQKMSTWMLRHSTVGGWNQAFCLGCAAAEIGNEAHVEFMPTGECVDRSIYKSQHAARRRIVDIECERYGERPEDASRRSRRFASRQKKMQAVQAFRERFT